MGNNKKRKVSHSDVLVGRKQNKNDDGQAKNDDKANIENNPLYREQQLFLSSLTPRERDCLFLQKSQGLTPERRSEIWMEQAEIGEGLVNKYAWYVYISYEFLFAV